MLRQLAVTEALLECRSNVDHQNYTAASKTTRIMHGRALQHRQPANVRVGVASGQSSPAAPKPLGQDTVHFTAAPDMPDMPYTEPHVPHAAPYMPYSTLQCWAEGRDACSSCSQALTAHLLVHCSSSDEMTA
jgi:hypothetical protein